MENFKKQIRAAAPLLVSIVYLAVALLVEEALRRVTDTKLFAALAYYVAPAAALAYVAVKERRTQAEGSTCAQCGGMAPLGAGACLKCGAPLPETQHKTVNQTVRYIVWVAVALLWGSAIFLVTITRFYGCCAPSHRACINVKSELASYAFAQEEYFTEHDAYAPSHMVLAPKYYKPDPQITIKHSPGSPSKDYFTVTGTYSRCDWDQDGKPDIFTWDSANGGLQR